MTSADRTSVSLRVMLAAGVLATVMTTGALAQSARSDARPGTTTRPTGLAVLETLPDSPTFARIQKRTYDFAAAGKSMEYEIFVPSTYDGAKPTPLVVALHCLSSDPHHMIRYEGLTDLAEARGYLIVAPMGYNSRGWYGSLGPGKTGPGGRAGSAEDPENLGALSEQDVMNVLGLVRKEFNVDARRIYLMGHSMGGGGTWYLGIKHPDVWAALAPAAPAIYSSPDALVAIKALPVTVVMGDNDQAVDIKVTRQWVAKMKELGMTSTYIEVPGADHFGVIARNPEAMRRIFDMFDKARRR